MHHFSDKIIFIREKDTPRPQPGLRSEHDREQQ